MIMAGKLGEYGRNFGLKFSKFGKDTCGHLLKAFGDLTGKYIEWDPTTNTFTVSGTLSLNGTSITATAAELNKSTLLASADRALKVAKIALAAVDTGGGIFAWANPESASIIVNKVVVDVTTKTTSACAIDVGVTPTSAATSVDNLIDGLDINAAIGVFDNITDKGTNGKSRQKLASGKWVTASVSGGGASAGLVGFAYIEYFVI